MHNHGSEQIFISYSVGEKKGTFSSWLESFDLFKGNDIMISDVAYLVNLRDIMLLIFQKELILITTTTATLNDKLSLRNYIILNEALA